MFKMISIVVPTYNASRHIERNIRNLLSNVPKNTEIIVVDDGSTDSTVSILKRFKKIKLITRKHTSPAKVRNVGWRRVKGDIVIFLDSDCYVTKNWFKEMTNSLKEKDIIAVSGVYLTKQKKLISQYIQHQITYRQSRVKKYTDNLASYSLAVKKKFLVKVGGFPEVYKIASAEDTELSYKLKRFGKFILNKKAKVYHNHSESIEKYLKKQFNHGRYRVLLYRRGNPVGDKYADFKILSQPILAFLSLFSILNPYFLFFLVGLIILQLTEIKTKLNEWEFVLFSMITGTIRAYVWMLGMIQGVLEFGT